MTPVVGYTEMRDSGIEWVGMIPKDWDINILFQLVSQVKNKNKDLAETNLLSLSYGKIKRKNIDHTDGLIPASFDSYNIIDTGDIVLRLTDLQNDQTSLRVGRSTEKGIITSAYITLRPVNHKTSKFLYYLLHAFDIRKGFYGMGAGVRQGLTYDEVKVLKLPLPSISEQTAIATYLDTQCAKIDEIIAEAKASIEDYKQWKASIIYEAVTKGLDPNAEMKDSGIEWIGEIPKEWLVTKMRKVTSFYNGDRTSRYPKPDDFVVAGVPFINSTNLNGDTLNMTSCKYITEEKYNSLSGTKLRPNDIVYCLRGSVGKCAINTTLQRGTVASSLMSIRAERINPYFLLFVLLSDVISRQTGVYINGTCAANLSAENVGGFAVPFPPAQEQGQIAECLMRKGAMIDELIADKSKFIANLDTYKKSLIYEVVTGKRRVC